MDAGLRGARAIVTGGTKGIGRAIVETLGREGADVAFCARNAADVASTQKALEALGTRAYGTALDIADGTALKTWAGKCVEALGGLDIVVSNVSALAIGADEDSWKRGFDIDMMGAVRLIETVLPAL